MSIERNDDLPQHHLRQGHYGDLPLEGLPDAGVLPSGTALIWDGDEWVFGIVQAGGGGDTVKVSSNDTTSNYLLDKLVAGTNITIVENNNGGNETITIDSLVGSGTGNISTYQGTVVDLGAVSLLTRRAAANAEDDHFNVGSLDGKWTHVNGSAPTFPTDMSGWIFIPSGAGIQQAVPAGDWIIETEVITDTWTAPGFSKSGLYLSNSSTITGNQRHFFVGTQNSVTTSQAATLQSHTNGSSVANIFVTSISVSPEQGRWFLRITKSGTTYTCDVSDTGKAWYRVNSTSSLGITPTHFGLCCFNSSGAGGYFNYFLRY